MTSDLRAIFRDELEDVLAVLEATLARLEGASGADRERAALEIRRAFHTLKGAAQAVGEDVIERVCHDAEAEISARHDDPAAVAPIAARAIPELRAGLAALSRGPGVPRDDELPREAPRGPADADTIRVGTERIDAVLAAADELGVALLAARSTEPLEQLRAAIEAVRAHVDPLAASAGAGRDDPWRARSRAAASSAREAVAVADRALRDARVAAGTVERELATLLAELRSLRLAPFAALVPGLERALSEAASTLGKRVELDALAVDVQLDRRTRDELRDPLLHLVRNAVDHGIELPAERARKGKPAVGRVTVTAAIVGGEVEVAVRDDGRGVDLESVTARANALGIASEPGADPLALVFEPGLSTRADVGPVSGRGLGLDVVRDRVARLHGSVAVRTERDGGTEVRMRVPLSSGALRVLHTRARGVHLLFPSTTVERLVRVSTERLVTIEGRLHLPDARAPIPLARVDAALGLTAGVRLSEPDLAWIVASFGGRRVALGVDALVGEGDVVARSLGGRVRRIACVSGTAVLADGDVALLVDVGTLLRLARPAVAGTEPASTPARRILVVDDSVTTRALQRTLLESAGYEVVVAADGQEALDRLLAGRFDAIVSDIQMPVLDGLELLARVRATPRTQALPVVLVTALDRETERRRALELGASAYVLKRDFDRDRLLDTLGDLL